MSFQTTIALLFAFYRRLRKHERVPNRERVLPPPPLDDRFGYGFEVAPSVVPLPAVVAPPPDTPPPKPDKFVADGEFYFKHDVLDQLEYYVGAIKRLKRHDYDVYTMVSRLGANLTPDRMTLVAYSHLPGPAREKVLIDNKKLEPWFLENLPGFGAVCYTTDKASRDAEKKDKRTSPRLFYFNKYAVKGRPSIIQPLGVNTKAVYTVGAVWDFMPTDDDKQATGISEVAVAIDADGAVRPLKIIQPRWVQFPHKNHKRSSRGFERREWDWPYGLAKFAKLNEMTPERVILNMFLGAAVQHQMFNSSMIRVAVKKDGVTAVMNVNILRTPYFFKDRDPVVVDGVTKRIFHIVRPHVRTNGAKVPMHFRGVREFDWNGYGIKITVPGVDHPIWAEAGMSAYDSLSEEGQRLDHEHKTISTPVFSRLVERTLDARQTLPRNQDGFDASREAKGRLRRVD